jgi:hypothetical protein
VGAGEGVGLGEGWGDGGVPTGGDGEGAGLGDGEGAGLGDGDGSGVGEGDGSGDFDGFGGFDGFGDFDGVAVRTVRSLTRVPSADPPNDDTTCRASASGTRDPVVTTAARTSTGPSHRALLLERRMPDPSGCEGRCRPHRKVVASR